MVLKKIKSYFDLLKITFLLFTDSNALKLSASLSYYTFFSLCPFLIVIISVAGLLYGKQAVQGKVYSQISGLVGNDAALQIERIIINIQKTNHSLIGSIIGFCVLLIGASGVFSEIQGSINFMWAIKPKPKDKAWLKLIVNYAWSFSLLGSVAFILLVSLTISSLIELLSQRLKIYFPQYMIYLFYALNLIFIFFIISILFAVIFRVLPDAYIKWKDAFKGGAFTAFLFLIGKLLIGIYLGKSSIASAYGATASIAIVMLWVYYSSIILYFGAAFTKSLITKTQHSSFMKLKRSN
jgi:membrane protein